MASRHLVPLHNFPSKLERYHSDNNAVQTCKSVDFEHLYLVQLNVQFRAPATFITI
jgi:hypothetical protein